MNNKCGFKLSMVLMTPQQINKKPVKIYHKVYKI